MSKKVNHSINLIKGCACIGVMLFHSEMYPPFAKILYIFADCAMPAFMVISGYYCVIPNENVIKKVIKRKMTHILWFLLKFVSLNLVWEIFLAIINGRSIVHILKTIFGIQQWVAFLSLGTVSQLYWFVTNLLFCYVFIYFIYRSKMQKHLMAIAIILFCIAKVLGIVNNIGGNSVDPFIFRSVWFFALPYFLMGQIIRNFQKEIENRYDEKKNLIVLAIAYSALLIEGYLLAAFGLGHQPTYFMAPVCLVPLFVFALNHPDFKGIGWIEQIGNRYYTLIYMTHMMIVYCMNFVLNHSIGFSNVVRMVYPIVLIFCAYIFAYMFYKTWDTIESILQKSGNVRV